MSRRDLRCVVTEKIWISPTVFRLKFKTADRVSFMPGQFLSVSVPVQGHSQTRVKRAYSIAGASESLAVLEFCVKRVDRGLGSNYLASLQPGDTFEAMGPFGDFVFDTSPDRTAIFVATGTGIAPFKMMVEARSFLESPPDRSMLVLGVANEREILFPTYFEQKGVEVVHALSRPSPGWSGFRGRVTDYFLSLPERWVWREADFYLCGNGEMISEVKRILVEKRGVSADRVRSEAYFTPADLPVKNAA